MYRHLAKACSVRKYDSDNDRVLVHPMSFLIMGRTDDTDLANTGTMPS